MEYAKQVMRLSELKEMGFPEEYLLAAYRNPKQTFAWRINPSRKNSPIVFDTEEFEKYRQAGVSQERLINRRREAVV